LRAPDIERRRRKRKIERCELDLEETSSAEENRLLDRSTLEALAAGSECELLPSILPRNELQASVMG